MISSISLSVEIFFCTRGPSPTPTTSRSSNFSLSFERIFDPSKSPDGSAETIPIFNYLKTPLVECLIESIKTFKLSSDLHS